MSAEMSAPKPVVVMVKPDPTPGIDDDTPDETTHGSLDQEVGETRFENIQVEYKTPPPRPVNQRPPRRGPDHQPKESNRRSGGDSTYKESIII